MARIYVAALDDARDRADLDRSVANAIDRQLMIRSFSDATYPELIDIERRGHGFFAWGLAADPVQIGHWFRMQAGDWVLIGWRDCWRYCARVLARYENPRAAREIWGEPAPGRPLREHLFFLSEPVPLKLPYAELADALPEGSSGFEPVDNTRLADIEATHGTLDRFVRRRVLNTSAGGPIVDMSGLIRVSEGDLARLRETDPQTAQEARQAIIGDIIHRRGQPALRQRLLEAYEGSCAITGFSAAEALEVALVVPWRGPSTHHPSNALLLRADIHTLFDLGRLAIDTRSMTVVVADELMQTSYRILSGRPLRAPEDEALRPSPDALDMHRRLAGL
jgi:hypothetical protein